MQCSSNLWGWEEMVSDSKKNERDRWNVRRFDTRIVLEHQLDLTVSHWRIERHGSLPWANWCLLVQFSRRSCFVRYNSWICCWCRFEDAPPMFEISSLRTHVFRVWEPSKRCRTGTWPQIFVWYLPSKINLGDPPVSLYFLRLHGRCLAAWTTTVTSYHDLMRSQLQIHS